MILDATTRKLQISLAATVATNQLPVVVDYVDMTASATTPGVQASVTNDGTAVDILGAPGSSTQRKVNGVSIFNADTAAVTVTVVLDDNGTDYQIINAMALAVGDTLTYTDVDGWVVSNRTGGGVENLRAGWVQEFTANGTWVKPGNCRFFLVDVVGGGGGGGAGQGNSSSTNARGGGGGGGGGKRNRALFPCQRPSRDCECHGWRADRIGGWVCQCGGCQWLWRQYIFIRYAALWLCGRRWRWWWAVYKPWWRRRRWRWRHFLWNKWLIEQRCSRRISYGIKCSIDKFC
jgi:hypothetical protein